MYPVYRDTSYRFCAHTGHTAKSNTDTLKKGVTFTTYKTTKLFFSSLVRARTRVLSTFLDGFFAHVHGTVAIALRFLVTLAQVLRHEINTFLLV
jgi:hypothetical protein